MIKKKRKIKVLIVDDDQDFGQSVKEALEELDFDSRHIMDPELTLNLLAGGNYHIIILDLQMPKIDGTELLAQIRKYHSDVNVIIVTGYPSIDSAIKTIKLAAFDYIKKPFKIDDLIKIIETIIEEKGLLADPEKILAREIGGKIRHLRKEHNLTLKQLGNRTGLSFSLISKIELGDSAASIATIYKISAALGTHISYFFEGVNTPRGKRLNMT
ncbi:MAG: response regulator [bacterium]